MSICAIHIPTLRAQPNRPPGYVEAVLAVGIVEGDYVNLSNKAYLDLLIKFRGPSGLGDIVSIAAKPVAAAIDSILGTDLANCQGCADRQIALNKAFPLT